MPEWNEEHLAKLSAGVAAWNEWRRVNPFVRPDLEDADLSALSLVQANLSYASVLNTEMSGVDATNASLSYANLGAARLHGAVLSGVSAYDSDFNGAELRSSDLSGARLSRCNFSRADMRETSLRGSVLDGAVFHATDLAGADFSGCRLRGTIFGAVDFRKIDGLEDVIHEGPSTIGIDSLMISEGRIPELFLRGSGISDAVIEYAKSLTSRPIEFYSCFLSHSSQDQTIANRLYADLQAEGVRCWFAPEDLKIGDKFRERIDESIRTYEKLLVILSAASISSAWVEAEVEAAFEKEQLASRAVLFPITLDDSIMKTGAAWAAQIRRTRHIGDFRHWEQPDSYAKAFERLMRDLRSVGTDSEP